MALPPKGPSTWTSPNAGFVKAPRKSPHRHKERVVKLTSAVMKSKAAAFLAEVIPHTPVDHNPKGPHPGRARGNWEVQFGNVTQTEHTDRDDTDGDPTLARAVSKLKRYSLVRNFNLHITNNASHITHLNDGGSYQEPAGFVERASATAELTERHPLMLADFPDKDE